MNATLCKAFDIEALNRKLETNTKEVVLKAEERMDIEVERAANAVLEKGEKLKMVLISGRSASGKTTFAKKLSKKLGEMGKEARHIALDDFFLGIDYLPLNDDGTYDMESIDGLDTTLANECFGLLLTKGEADFPIFDFPNQCRSEKQNKIKLAENGIIVIEGIHALNPLLTEKLPEDGVVKMFIEPKNSYCIGEKKIFSPQDVRLMRRMTRDELFRGWSAEKTFAQWKSVLSGEKIYIEPYIDFAEMNIDSSMYFEPSVFKDILSDMLSKIGEDSIFFDEAKEIKEKLSLFVATGTEILNKDSLLREFVG